MYLRETHYSAKWFKMETGCVIHDGDEHSNSVKYVIP
jgi:hypothetical protein